MSSEDKTTQTTEVTDLLRAWNDGDGDAVERLIPLVYAELHRLAARYLNGERQGHTLQTTALVHEAFIRLLDQRSTRWRDRRHFFAIAAQAMRRILVDHARQRQAEKRGGGVAPLILASLDNLSSEPRPDLVALDESLTSLKAVDPLKVSIVELHFFGGFSLEETAGIVELSRATVARHLSTAKAWLHRDLTRAP